MAPQPPAPSVSIPSFQSHQAYVECYLKTEALEKTKNMFKRYLKTEALEKTLHTLASFPATVDPCVSGFGGVSFPTVTASVGVGVLGPAELSIVSSTSSVGGFSCTGSEERPPFLRTSVPASLLGVEGMLAKVRSSLLGAWYIRHTKHKVVNAHRQIPCISTRTTPPESIPHASARATHGIKRNLGPVDERARAQAQALEAGCSSAQSRLKADKASRHNTIMIHVSLPKSPGPQGHSTYHIPLNSLMWG
jgi:hypothetical protein